MSSPDRAHLEHLADTLWAERKLVEYLLFKLVAAKLLLASDDRRFVPAALNEVERALHGLRVGERERAAAVAIVAAGLRVGPERLSLQWLAEWAPAPFDRVFADHRSAFLQLTDEIERTARANSKLASAALQEVNRTLTALSGEAGISTYDAAGQQRAAHAAPGRLNKVL